MTLHFNLLVVILYYLKLSICKNEQKYLQKQWYNDKAQSSIDLTLHDKIN